MTLWENSISWTAAVLSQSFQNEKPLLKFLQAELYEKAVSNTPLNSSDVELHGFLD